MSTGEGQVRSSCGGGRGSDLPPGRGSAAPVELVLIRFEVLVSSELEVGSISEAGLVFLFAEDGLALTSSAPPAVWLPRRPLLLAAAPRVLLLPLPLLSEELLLSFNGVLLLGRILFPRPRPLRISTSLVGDSQNLKTHKGSKTKLANRSRKVEEETWLHLFRNSEQSCRPSPEHTDTLQETFTNYQNCHCR